MITDDELRQIMPKCPATRRAEYLPFINQAMEEFEITSNLRQAAFLAQLAHETLELSVMEERDSSATFARYEGRKELGNSQPGDGKRFKGRGPFSLTGRANYQKLGELLKLDLISKPEIVASKEVGFRAAGVFWKQNGFNELADKERFNDITRRLGGSAQPQPAKLLYYDRARKVLGTREKEMATKLTDRQKETATLAKNKEAATLAKETGTLAKETATLAKDANVGTPTVAEPSPAPATKAKRPATKKSVNRQVSEYLEQFATSETTEQPHSDFRFSSSAQEVLERAGALAERSERGGINSSCLLFAIADREAPEIYTERFVFDLLEREGGYDEALQRF